VAVEELARARLFCDDWAQASHGGELTGAVAAGVVVRDTVTELGAVLAGDSEGRRDDNEVTLFDSTGLAIQDLAIAKAAVAKLDEIEPPTIEL
jgi:ornithine cyclodeaminase/alanine dehydrogenase-like protein (mu-crystallin family)